MHVVAFYRDPFARRLEGQRNLLLKLSNWRVDRKPLDKVPAGEGRLGRGNLLRDRADYHDLRLVGRQHQRQADRILAGSYARHEMDLARPCVPHLRSSVAGDLRRARLRLIAFVEDEVQVGVAPGAVGVLERGARAIERDIGLRQRCDDARGNIARGLDKGGEAEVRLLSGIPEGPLDHDARRDTVEDYLAAGSSHRAQAIERGARDRGGRRNDDRAVDLPAEVAEGAVFQGRDRAERLLVEVIEIDLVLQ